MGLTLFTCTIRSVTSDYTSHFSVGTSRCSFFCLSCFEEKRGGRGGRGRFSTHQALGDPKMTRHLQPLNTHTQQKMSPSWPHGATGGGGKNASSSIRSTSYLHLQLSSSSLAPNSCASLAQAGGKGIWLPFLLRLKWKRCTG